MSQVHSGIVKNASLAEPLAEVEIKLLSTSGQTKTLHKTTAEGDFTLDTLRSNDTLIFEKEGYISKSIPVEELNPVIRLLEDRLIGYQNKIGYFPGERAKVFIHAPRSFTATLCRHGLKKEVLWQKKDLSEQSQSVPDGYFVRSGLNWEETLEYQIPKNARPGIYSLLLEADHEEPFAIPMVVQTPKHDQRSKLLVLCSTNNWQTYNIWGGRSRYRNYEQDLSDDYMNSTGIFAEMASNLADSLPQGLVATIKNAIGWEKSNPPWVFDPLSIKRPHTNCLLEGDDPENPFTNHLASGEWRVLAWLEHQQIEYDIATGLQLHQNPDLLKDYRGIILSTHCEYWSKQMYKNLKREHQNNKMWIINLSGNSIYREVDFQEDGSIRCLSTKFHQSVEDETQVIGVRFTESDYGTCAPYRIQKPNHWIFDDLPKLSKGELFGEESLNRWTKPRFDRYDPGRPGVQSGLRGKGASGWETDKLSRTAPGDFVVVAKGRNSWGGADMVVREPSGDRGGVFSASSITFGGSLLVDEVCSKIVQNVLDKILE